MPAVLRLERLIQAPPAVVWRAWADPQALPRWFGPQGFTCRTKEMRLGAGGLWRFDMIGPDGTIYANRHRYDLWQAPGRIAFRMDSDDDALACVQVVVTPSPAPEGTLYRQELTLASEAALQEALAFGADRLGQQTLDKLAALVEGRG